MSHLLSFHLQDLFHGDNPGAGEVLAVLAHLDGLQPFRHRPEGRAIWAAGAWQADGYAGKVKWIQMIIISRLSPQQRLMTELQLLCRKPVIKTSRRSWGERWRGILCPFSPFLALMRFHKGESMYSHTQKTSKTKERKTTKKIFSTHNSSISPAAKVSVCPDVFKYNILTLPLPQLTLNILQFCKIKLNGWAAA